MACRKDGKGRVLRKGEHYRKSELRSTTYANYVYTWNHFIRDTFGKKKIKDVKYSDVLFFYTDLIQNQHLQVNTLESINTVLRPAFQLAVRDNIIRKNPVDGAYAEVKKERWFEEDKKSFDSGAAKSLYGVCSKQSILLSLVSILYIPVRNWMQNWRSDWHPLG